MQRPHAIQLRLRVSWPVPIRLLMKKSAIVLLTILLGVPPLFGQQAQAALPAGSTPPAATAPAPATPPSQSSDMTVVEEIIARVNNSIISRSDLKRSEDQLASEAGKADPSIPAENQPQQKDLLRDLIDTQLLSQKAEELGMSADTDVVKRLDELRKQMHAESMEDLEKAAQAQGVSFEEFKQNLKNQILTQRVIQQEEDLQLRLDLVGNAVDDQVGVADSFFDGGGEGDVRHRSRGFAKSIRTEHGPKGLLGMVEVGGHHVFEQDGEAGAGGGESQPAAEGPCSDDGYGRWQQDYWAERAWTTSSALGLALSRCSATRARSSAVRVGMVARMRRRVTATSSM